MFSFGFEASACLVEPGLAGSVLRTVVVHPIRDNPRIPARKILFMPYFNKTAVSHNAGFFSSFLDSFCRKSTILGLFFLLLVFLKKECFF